MRYLGGVDALAIGAVAYGLFGLAWIYGLLDTGVLEDREVAAWTAIAVVTLAHAVFGFALARWVALLFPLALVLLAVPAGYPESNYEPLPVWVPQAFWAPFEIAFLAVGVSVRKLAGRRRPNRSRSGSDPGRASSGRVLLKRLAGPRGEAGDESRLLRPCPGV
ncbi:MAG: hypothetical protein ACRDON_11685 [Gaiellaceae bacterium]